MVNDFGNITITYKLFKKIMKSLIKQYNKDLKCTKAFSIILSDSYPGAYDNYTLSSQLINILKLATNDTEKHSTIEDFIYELDFGKQWKKGFLYFNGKDIPLASIDDLWKALVLFNEYRQSKSN